MSVRNAALSYIQNRIFFMDLATLILPRAAWGALEA